MYIIILILIVVGFMIGLSLKKANDENRNSEAIHNYLINHNNELYKLIINQISVEKFTNQLENLLSYEIFKESCMEVILDYVNEYVDKEGYHWIKFDYKIDISKLTSKDIQIATIEILESKEIDSMLATIFVNKITENIKEAEQLEKEAIAYHKSFGSEPAGDPELHNKDLSDNISEEITERRLEDLISTGTIEDIPE